MPQTRKRALDAARSVLADADYGFNAQFAAIAAAYGLTDACVLDWGAGSETVFSGNVRNVGLTQLNARVTLQLSTGASVWTGDTRGVKWSGAVEVNLDFLIRYSADERDDDQVEQDDIESLPNAIEDAVVEVFARKAIDWGALGVVYLRPPDCPGRPEAALEGGGWAQEVPIRVGFKVDAAY